MAENAGNTGASALTAKMMASSPASEKKHRSNGNASPAHQASNHSSPAAAETLTPPAVSEKKPQTNGQASPVRLPANGSNSHAGKQCLEGFLKTDDRMRLAKERREERERSLVAREQAIREKERRAQLQYERTVEERWKRLEEQKLKEEQRRAAVEEKRRQQLEEEKERLEALMRKSLERSLQLENRTKRWMWGGNGPGHGDWENAPPLSAASALPYDLATPSAAASESGNVTSSPHRSPYRGSPSRRRGNTAFTEELGRGSNTAPSTPKKGSLRRERGAASPATGSPVRRADDVIRRSASPASPATPKLTPKRRNQSPATVRQYPASPLRHRAAAPAAGSSKGPEENVTDDKQDANVKSQDPADQKPLQAEEASRKSPDSVIPGTAGKIDSPIQKASSPEAPEKGARKTENPSGAVRAASGQKIPNYGNQEEQSLKTGIAHNPSTNNPSSCKSTDQSPATPTQKTAAMVTDAEEASRLLAERKRLAQVQKKQEELERQKPELIKRKVDERVREEEETQHEEDELGVRKTEEDLQVQLEQERDVAERQRQDRELMQQQEEQERQQRKKRIEEIMKRTRKNDGELKREDNQESQLVSPLSPPGEVQVDSKPRSEAKAPPTGAQAGSTPGSQAPPTGAQAGSTPGSQAPPTGAQAGSTPGSQAPPTGAQAGSAPGSQAPPTGAQAGSTPGRQTPPNGAQAGSTPGSHTPVSAAQARSALDSWVKPPAPVTPSRQNSMEKRSESFGGNERPHAPAQVPSPNGQVQSAKPLDQKGGRGPEKIQSSSTSRGEEVGKDNSSPEKGQANQPKATAEAIAQKHENVLPDQDREREAPQVKVPLPSPQPQATSTRAGEVKRSVPERTTNPHEAWAAQSKSAVKMPDSPQVNGQVKPQICAAQLNTQATPQPNGQTPSQVMLKGEVKERSPASLPPLAVSWSPLPLISLEPLEGRGGAREKSVDEVQSMEISPVSKEELISIPRFSPVADVRPNSVSKTRALEDLLDLTGQVAYPKLPPSATVGDCNKNLIEGVCSPGSETKVITSSPPPSNKLNIQ